MRHGGLQFDLPPDFGVDQVMISLRGAPATAPDPRVLQKQTPIRPSLIINRRHVGNTASLEVLAGEVTAELVTSVPGLSELATEEMAFNDGAPGIIVSFSFALEELGTARQLHALRKDGNVLTTLTLTIDKLSLNDAGKQRWFNLIASTVKDGEGALA
jgi:hypothetical protein